MAYLNVRPVVALLAWVKVKLPLATADKYMVPFPNSAAALAVVGIGITVDPVAQFASVTVVDAAPVVSVKDPTALERPAANCCSDRENLVKSFSSLPGI
jgi:hypothetical protein